MIGQGIYPLSDVARFTNVPISTVRSWFRPRSDGAGSGPLFNSDWEVVDNDYAVSFLNLIEVLVAAEFRKKGVKPKDIRAVYKILSEEWNLVHPFASQDLYATGASDARRIILDRSDDSALIDVLKKQMIFEHTRDSLERVRYGENRQAIAWDIADGVVINPKIGFGKPVIQGTGVSTLVIAKQFVANGRNAELVAKLFKIDADGVRKAYEFEHKFKRIAA